MPISKVQRNIFNTVKMCNCHFLS